MISLEEAKELASAVTLKSESLTTVRIEERDLENWIRDIFGKELEFVATVECGNDSTHEFSVEIDNSHYHEEEAEDFLYGYAQHPPNYDIGSVLNVLCRDGFIPKGEYLISVCW